MILGWITFAAIIVNTLAVSRWLLGAARTVPVRLEPEEVPEQEVEFVFSFFRDDWTGLV